MMCMFLFVLCADCGKWTMEVIAVVTGPQLDAWCGFVGCSGWLWFSGVHSGLLRVFLVCTSCIILFMLFHGVVQWD